MRNNYLIFFHVFRVFRRPFFLWVSAFFAGCFFMGCSNPTTPTRPRVTVTENITANTVWEGGTDYVISGRIAVASGARLTIGPDAAVSFEGEGSLLEVRGSLHADGGAERRQSAGRSPKRGLTGVQGGGWPGHRRGGGAGALYRRRLDSLLGHPGR